MGIVVDDVSTWPPEVLKGLRKPELARSIKSQKDRRGVLSLPEMKEAARVLKLTCESTPLRVFHCTKEKYRGYFEKHGLRTTQGKLFREDFLREFGGRFSPETRNRMEDTFRDLNEEESDPLMSRDGMIYFFISRIGVFWGSTECLFEYYGGEIINMAFIRDPGENSEIACVLRSIGNPVVVEFEIRLEEWNSSSLCDIGELMASYYAYSINSRIEPISTMGSYVNANVPPDRIVRVYPESEFRERYYSGDSRQPS